MASVIKTGGDDIGADVFIGDGEMARLMRATDWSATPLGPVADWPDALKVALRILLTSRFEMWLGWGPDVAFFYNDAYRPTLGRKHPASLGMPTKILWSEIWDAVEPRVKAVYERGEATWDRALLLLLERDGYPEETYHTFSYSPLIGTGGAVEGLFCAVSEETERVISERRFESLRRLATELQGADSRAGVLDAAGRILAANGHDVPFGLLYLFAPDGARLVTTAGMDRTHRLAVPVLQGAAGDPWPIVSTETIVDLSAVADRPSGAWARPPARACCCRWWGRARRRRSG